MSGRTASGNSLTRPGMGKPHHNLPGGDNLARFTQCLNHRAVRVRCKGRIGRFVFCDTRLGFCRGQLGLGRIKRGLGQFVALHGHCGGLNQCGVALLIGAA